MEFMFCRDKIKRDSGILGDSGSYFERGWHEVRYSVKDKHGLQSTCAFHFTVKGNCLINRFDDKNVNKKFDTFCNR